jgi:acetate---CoA ligase (ADP-forming)
MFTKTTHVQENLKAMFEPQSIAIIGASRKKEAVGHGILMNLLEAYKGDIFPVNPKTESIEGHKCFDSIESIPTSIDLAIIVVKNTFTAKIMEQCAAKGVKAVIIISAGFKETGDAGKALEDQVIAIAEENNIAVLGPNCLGLINTSPSISMNASFAPCMPPVGNIALISQSGAICTAILDYARGKHIGFSKFISVGNKACLGELELLRYLKDDPDTDVVLMYIEDLSHGREFIELARDFAAKKKPILVIKSGRTAQGAKAASSHTGSLMGSDEVYDAIFKQAGVIRVNSMEDLFDFATAFAHQNLPNSNNTAIVTNAGGPGIMATDACVQYGLEIAELEESTISYFKETLPAAANVYNPVDVIGDAQSDRYKIVLERLIEDKNVDSIIALLTPQSMTDIENIARTISEIDKKTEKPIVASFMGEVLVKPGITILEKDKIPHYTFPKSAAKAVSTMSKYKSWTERSYGAVESFSVDVDKVHDIIAKARAAGKTFLTINESMDIFRAYKMPLLPYCFASSREEALTHSKEVGYPMAMKIVSEDVIHKFDMGGVALNISSDEEMISTYDAMISGIKRKLPDANIEGVFMQKMGAKGKEVILGMNRDPQFGPVIMFGLGGIYVEALKDVSFRLAPLDDFSIRSMIKEIHAYAILEGIRGEKPVDFTMMIECIKKLSQLSCDHPEIDEIDINPLLAYEESLGAHVIDARIILTEV